jgi:hypothetical protein
VIGPDVGRLAQIRPGEQVRFAVVSIDDAVAARRAEAAVLETAIETMPVMRRNPTSELLLDSNLISGVISGTER